MPADPATQVAILATSAAIVSGVATLLLGLGWGLARWLGRPLFPDRTRFRASWNGVDLIVFFLLNVVFNTIVFSVLSASGFYQAVYGPEFPDPDNAAHLQVRMLWASLFATPLLLLVAVGLWFGFYRRPTLTRFIDLPGHVALGVIGWAALTPIVFAVHYVAIMLANRLGGGVENHPLTQLGAGDSLFDRVLFAVTVCFLTPLAEEFLFRGLLVRWAAGRAFRPWVLMGFAGGMALLSAYRVNEPPQLAPLVFVAVLGGGLMLLRWLAQTKRIGVRKAMSVYASAAVFAMAHSAVWPTPVPLFVLGLGLGYLALRTGGIAASTVMHGLFNAVSFVFLLRGGTG